MTGFVFLDYMFWGNPISSYILFLIYIVLGLIFIKLISSLFNSIFKKQEEKGTRYEILFKILRKPEPILFIIFVAVLKGASRVFKTSTALSVIIDKFAFCLYVLLGAWFLIKVLVAVIEKYLGKISKENEDIKRYDYLVPLIKTLIKVFIFAIAALLIVSNLGYNVNGLIAGLGLGGIALAFASKELLENFFSGLIIYIERPIKVGDLVKTNDNLIYGEIKEIGIRTTKIESFDGTIYTVPNTVLSGKPVENISVMPGRRVVATLSLSPKCTAEQIGKAEKFILDALNTKKKKRELLEESHVYFDKYSTFSIDIIYIYWLNKNIDYWEQMDIKDSINKDIKKELDKAKIELASPAFAV